MKRVLISFFMLSFLIPGALYAQRDSLRNEFLDAESWFLLEEFADALPIYQGLLNSDPGNDNLKYRIGICLLNDPYQKDKSIEYLLDASDNINPNYKENSFKERTAPPDVLYYLGEAYLVNELLDRAIESFEQFLEIMDREIYDEELVQFQIRACNNAKRLKSMPVDIDLYPLDSLINTRYADIRPVVSGDGSKMVFVTELPFFDGAFYCEKTGDGWSYPQPITQTLGFDADIYPVCLSHDGTEMIMYYDDEYIGNLYYSNYEDGRWNPAEKLGENISTKYWESHASFSRDGKSLYFTSNRKGTLGGLDIYSSERQLDGNWGEPTNLGPTINSRYNEETPFITEDGQTLYFSSYGHFNMGGYDVFFSRKNPDGTWGEPINLGYPINTTDDDLHFQPVKNGYGAYYSIYSNVGRGEHDIYYMDIYSVDNPRMYYVTGNLRTEDGSIDSTRIAIFVVDSQTGDTVMYTSPDQETGEFTLHLKQGIYELHFKGEGYEDLIRPLRITRGSDKGGIKLDDNIELALVKKEPLIFVGEESQIGLRDTLYEGDAGETIEVPVRLQKGSTLITRVYQDSVLVSVDTIEVDRRRTTLEIDPLPGDSRIELEMIDPDGNIHKHGFDVVGKVPEVEPEYRTDTEPIEGPEPDGTLNVFLDDLDPEKEGITSQKELFEHLYEQAESKGYSQEEVDMLLGEEVAQGDTDLLRQRLSENADGPLKEYLESLELAAEGIQTPGDLIRHLQEAAEENGFTMAEVREALLESIDQLPLSEVGPDLGPVANMLHLLKQDADGALHEFLIDLDPDQEGITSLRELFEHIYQQADSQDYSQGDVDKLLGNAVAEGDTELLRQRLLENAKGPLKEYLENLDMDAEGIQTPEDLIRHLEKVANENDFTMEEVREALLDSLDKLQEDEAGLYWDPLVATKSKISGQASPELQRLLDNLDTSEEGIATPGDLFEYLYGKTDPANLADGEDLLNTEEIDRLLTDAVSNGDVQLLYQHLLENSDGSLKEYLESLDLEQAGIITPEDLIRHLEEMAESNGFTMDDVRKAMIGGLDNPLEVDRIYSELLESAEEPIREVLKGLNLRKEGIYQVEELISTLYRELEALGYSSREIRNMLNDLFPSHAGFIKKLGKQGLPVSVIVLLGAGLFILIILLWRRRKKKENTAE